MICIFIKNICYPSAYFTLITFGKVNKKWQGIYPLFSVYRHNTMSIQHILYLYKVEQYKQYLLTSIQSN